MMSETDTEALRGPFSHNTIFSSEYYDTSLDWVPTSTLRGAAHRWYPFFSRMFLAMESVGEYFVRLIGMDASRYECLTDQRDALHRRENGFHARSTRSSLPYMRGDHSPNTVRDKQNVSVLVGEKSCKEEDSYISLRGGQPRPFPIHELPEEPCKRISV